MNYLVKQLKRPNLKPSEKYLLNVLLHSIIEEKTFPAVSLSGLYSSLTSYSLYKSLTTSQLQYLQNLSASNGTATTGSTSTVDTSA